jgi:hypothetical protein
MHAIKATWTNGRILPTEPVDWPEGLELVVEPWRPADARIGIDESEWRDDAEALADWDAWIQTIQPRVLTDGERAAAARFEEEFRRYNIEAVRRQMGLGDNP